MLHWKTKPNSPAICVYCRGVFLGRDLSEDHIPPQGIFGKEWARKNKRALYSVPVCKKCNAGSCDDDDAFKGLLNAMAGACESIAEVREDVQRGMRFNARWRMQLLDATYDAPRLVSATTNDLRVVSLPPDYEARIERVIKRTATGMWFHFDPHADHQNYVWEFTIMTNEQRLKRAILAVMPECVRTVDVGGTRFTCYYYPDGSGYGMLLIFYRKLGYFIRRRIPESASEFRSTVYPKW